MNISSYILSILRMQPNIVFSWGFNRCHALSNGIIFRVQGYLFKGWVKVIYVYGRDTFTVVLLNNSMKTVKEVEDVYLDNLIQVIDRNVECDDSFDYEQRVRDEYSLS